MGKSLPDLCTPKAKLPALSYWFLAKVSPIFKNTERIKKSVQLTQRYSSTPEKQNSISAKKDLLVPNTTSFIAYWKTVYENARGIRYVVACSIKLLELEAGTTLNKPATVNVINF